MYATGLELCNRAAVSCPAVRKSCYEDLSAEMFACFGSDRATAVTGRQRGAVALLSEKINLNPLVIHGMWLACSVLCFTVHDAVKHVTELNYFHIFIKSQTLLLSLVNAQDVIVRNYSCLGLTQTDCCHSQRDWRRFSVHLIYKCRQTANML